MSQKLVIKNTFYFSLRSTLYFCPPEEHLNNSTLSNQDVKVKAKENSNMKNLIVFQCNFINESFRVQREKLQIL